MKNIFSVLKMTIVIFIIFNSFFKKVHAEEIFNLYTEDYPPYNMPLDEKTGDNENEITGSATETLKEIFKRAKIKYSMELLPWARAYNFALKRKNAVVFAASRTPERENLFKWVGPIGENSWVFFSLIDPKTKKPKIKINSMDDAKKYLIGCYKDDATSIYLRSLNFKVEDTNNDINNERKLQAGRIDLWASGKQLGSWQFKKFKINNIAPVFTIKNSVLYAAFNIETSDEIINKLNQINKDIHDDGTYLKIQKNY
jgi:polar amino acid transport system substrate-binding protein